MKTKACKDCDGEGSTDEQTCGKRNCFCGGCYESVTCEACGGECEIEIEESEDEMTGKVLLGDQRVVLADVECDAMVADPPYSARVHRAGALIEGKDDAERSVAIGYEAFTTDHVHEFCNSWSPRVRGWMAIHTSHDLIPDYENAFKDCGRYVFPPVPCVMKGMSVRLQGDGPSSWCCYLVVARPKHKDANQWGTLPGAYVGAPPSRASAKGDKSIVMGQKPQWLINAIVRDYSRHGDLVCDPFSGSGTTARACESLGRNFIGAEVDPETHAAAAKRICGGVQIDLFGGMV